MVFSVFFLVWNLLVAVVLVSVARTQTISIRRSGVFFTLYSVFKRIQSPTTYLIGSISDPGQTNTRHNIAFIRYNIT